MDEPENGKRRRRRADKGEEAVKGPKVKTSVNLSPEAYRRLAIHAVGERTDMSAVVEDLVTTHLRRYVLQDRGGPQATEIESPASSADETLTSTETLTPPDDTSGGSEPEQGRGKGGKRRPAA